MGLLLGTIPGIIRLHGDMRPRVDRMVAAVVGIAVVIGLNVLEARISDGSGLTLADLNRLPGAAYNLLISVLGGGASVTPGLDGSMVLILGGTYKPILDVVKHPMQWLANWIPLTCTALGVVVGIVAFSKSIDALIKRSPSLAYYGVLGLVLGSVWALRPTQAPNVAWWVLVLALLAGIAVAVALGGREPEVE
jgi:putative membrane protein